MSNLDFAFLVAQFPYASNPSLAVRSEEVPESLLVLNCGNLATGYNEGLLRYWVLCKEKVTYLGRWGYSSAKLSLRFCLSSCRLLESISHGRIISSPEKEVFPRQAKVVVKDVEDMAFGVEVPIRSNHPQPPRPLLKQFAVVGAAAVTTAGY